MQSAALDTGLQQTKRESGDRSGPDGRQFDGHKMAGVSTQSPGEPRRGLVVKTVDTIKLRTLDIPRTFSTQTDAE